MITRDSALLTTSCFCEKTVAKTSVGWAHGGRNSKRRAPKNAKTCSSSCRVNKSLNARLAAASPRTKKASVGKINKDGYSPDSKGRKLAFQEKTDSELFALLHPTTSPDNADPSTS